jgi:hypothetical protein
MPSQTYGNGRTSVNDDDRVPERRYGLLGVPEKNSFFFIFFFTYFLILTDADTVPNGHKRPNGDERR